MGGGVPNEVFDGEELARRCSRKHIRKSDGRVKRQAFSAAKKPFNISVDRLAYCNPWVRVRDINKETIVTVQAGRVRSEIQEAEVVASPQLYNPAHADIRIRIPPEDPVVYETKKQLQESAELFARHMEICEALAKMASELKGP